MTHDTYFNGMPNIVGPLSDPFPDKISGALKAQALVEPGVRMVSLGGLLSVGDDRAEGYGR